MPLASTNSATAGSMAAKWSTGTSVGSGVAVGAGGSGVAVGSGAAVAGGSVGSGAACGSGVLPPHAAATSVMAAMTAGIRVRMYRR